MYTRSYAPDESAPIKVPENYDGNAFTEPPEPVRIQPNEPNPAADAVHTSSTAYETGIPKDIPEESVPASGSGGILDGILGSPILKRFIPSGLFGGRGLRSLPDRIGTEEILIIGVALFLIFSRGGDTECAIMLLLLLFIN